MVYLREHLSFLVKKRPRGELRVGFELLQRSLEALNLHDFLKSSPDLWLYFYEDFLAAYDPKLRKDSMECITHQGRSLSYKLRLANELHRSAFLAKRCGFADDGVIFSRPCRRHWDLSCRRSEVWAGESSGPIRRWCGAGARETDGREYVRL